MCQEIKSLQLVKLPNSLYLPSHRIFPLQPCNSFLPPTQSFPPNFGIGLSQYRTRNLEPPKQVSEQSVQFVHCENPP